MAVAFVNQVASDQGLATSFSQSFTPGTGVNLVVAALTVSSTITGLSVTYAGAAMTLLDSVTVGAASIYLYYTINPPAGAATVTASWTNSVVSSFAVRGYSGVNTVNPFGTVAKGTGTSATAVATVTSNPQELMIDAGFASGANLSAPGAGQTQEYNTSININSAGSYLIGAAIANMSWTLSASVSWAEIAVPIRPQTSFFLMF